MLEVVLVVLLTAGLEYPNPATSTRGDMIIRNMLIDCRRNVSSNSSWVCSSEESGDRGPYIGLLAFGTIVELVITTITFGVKVPSGIIMPALEAGALFGRLMGQITLDTISPGIFAMVGAGAFLAGVSRMTISLCIIMFELTGQLEYIVPHMIAILVAKWTADFLSRESVYDLTQSALGHPYLDPEESLHLVQENDAEVMEKLVPPKRTMEELTVFLPSSHKVARRVLEEKVKTLQGRGLMDSGLVIVNAENGILQGYIPQRELEHGLQVMGSSVSTEESVRLLPSSSTIDRTENDADETLDLTRFVNRSPLTVSTSSPVEVAIQIFTALGVRYLCITEEGSGRLVGVVIRKRVLAYLDELKKS